MKAVDGSNDNGVKDLIQIDTENDKTASYSVRDRGSFWHI